LFDPDSPASAIKEKHEWLYSNPEMMVCPFIKNNEVLASVSIDPSKEFSLTRYIIINTDFFGDGNNNITINYLQTDFKRKRNIFKKKTGIFIESFPVRLYVFAHQN
jgi:hypothetical protein